jgi:hypothetical protein
MAVFKIACPECGATLKSSNPMSPGKKVKCPKCATAFTVPVDGDGPAEAGPEAVQPKPAAKAAPAARKAAPSPPPRKDDDEDVGIYKFIDEPQPERGEDEDEDEKPDITFALDTSVKDIRGPARAKLVRPTNYLMFAGALTCFFELIAICWAIFPLIFSSEWVPIHEVIGWKPSKPDEPPPEIDRKTLKPEEEAKVEAAESVFLVERLIDAGGAVVGLLINGVVVFGAVKMQNLESYAWGMVASIVGMIFSNACCIPLGLIFGIWCLVTLLDKQVKEAFKVEAEEVRKRGGAMFG